MDDKDLVELRLQYAALYQMHWNIAARGCPTDNKARLEHLGLAGAYEVGLHMIERLMDWG